jgi:3-phosphoshikimate 1-carboxyvinyltransferase
MKYGCFTALASRRHSYQPSAGTRQRRSAKERAKAFEVATVSARALIIRAAPDASRDQAGTRPQRATLTTGVSARDDWRTTGAGSVGAMLKSATNSPSVSSTASKSVARSAALRVDAYRPHMSATVPLTLAHRSDRQNRQVPDTTLHPGPAAWTAPTASRPVVTTVRLPGSKSMSARALVLSALANAPSIIYRPLLARDTVLMSTGLRAMGTRMSTMDDGRWEVQPGPLRGPAQIDVGLAGTVMRFLPPVAALAHGTVSFDGDPHARQRPMTPLLRALSDLGVSLEPGAGGGLPLVVHGGGRVRGGEVTIDASTSSQLVSGLLLAAPAFERGLVVHHVGPPVPSAPHLRMTVAMLQDAGASVDDSVPDIWSVEPGPLAGRDWLIEPDLSGAAPFLAAAMVTGGEVTVPDWPHDTTQPGDQLRELLSVMGASVTLDDHGLTLRGSGHIRGLEADLSDVSELTPVLAALAVLGDRPSRLRGVAHIRGHETDRVSALATELGRLGAEIVEWEDGLEIRPRPLHGGLFGTYDDHRMAHAAAVVGLVAEGIEIDNVGTTAKTMPEFPQVWSRLIGG